MHEVLGNRLGGLSLPRKSEVRLTDCPDMTLDVYRGCKTTTRWGFPSFLSKTYLQNLDLSYKIDLDFLDCFGRDPPPYLIAEKGVIGDNSWLIIETLIPETSLTRDQSIYFYEEVRKFTLKSSSLEVIIGNMWICRNDDLDQPAYPCVHLPFAIYQYEKSTQIQKCYQYCGFQLFTQILVLNLVSTEAFLHLSSALDLR